MQGLTEKEAIQRRKKEGENILAQAKKTNPMKLFLGQFRDVMVMILLAATAVSAFLGEFTDAITIILIVLLNAVLGFIQEFRTEKTLETLRELTAPFARVLRDGTWKTIPAKELVSGDIVQVEAGDSIPADCVIQECSGLSVNESVLTGESTAVSKLKGNTEDNINALNKKNILYSGTAVLRGNATAKVIAIGTKTQVGQISTMLSEIDNGMTPLQKRLASLGKVVAIICVAVCIVVFLAGVLRGEPFFDMLMTGITIAIAAIPEGLPATVTIALALAVNRMMKHKALVNRLHSVETLGCAGVICSDKTGTITENKMTVTNIMADGNNFTVSGTGLQSKGVVLQDGKAVNINRTPVLKSLFDCCVLCTTAEISSQVSAGEYKVSGDPTETALLVAAAKGGIHQNSYKHSHKIISTEPFDSETRRMIVTVQENGSKIKYAKGSTDKILDMCNHIFINGSCVAMTDVYRREIDKSSEALSNKALRVLAFAKTDENTESFIFLGLTGMLDPPRESAKIAIRTCTQAKINTVMITGDHKNTALAIAEQAGLLHGRKAMTGDELDALTEEKLSQCINEYGVFARVNPAHKLRLVRAYKKSGAIVAMTGDGVNDAPAIKEADVGVAMGKSGTDVARQAADVILLDDNFATLVYAVEQGRCIYSNIRKFVRYLLSCNIGEVITMFLGILMGMPVVLLPTQLLLVNLITDGLPAIALGMEPPDNNAMKKPPRKPDESFFSDGLLHRILFRGILIGLCTLGTFSTVLRMGGTLEAARTTALCTLILSQLIHVFECKSETEGLFSISWFNNKKLLLAAFVSLIVLILTLKVPALQLIFSTVNLNIVQILVMLLFSFAIPVISSFSMKKKVKSELS